jgi:hypothetical protein
MVEITLFEFNVDAEELTGNAPFSGRSGSDRDDEDELAAADDDGRNPRPILVGAGLLVLVLAVVAGRRFLGGEPESLP